MINICVHTVQLVTIEIDEFVLDNQDDIIAFLHTLITKIKYGGETICLEKVTVINNENQYEEIDRW